MKEDTVQPKSIIPRNRSLIFLISGTVIVVSCLLHGMLAGARTDRTFDRMIASGNLTGKFWRIVEIQHDHITVTKYKRTVILVWHQPGSLKIGDRVSFMAVPDNTTSSNTGLQWHPVSIKIHGRSTLKFGISFISALIAAAMCIRYIRFDRQTVSLTFSRGSN